MDKFTILVLLVLSLCSNVSECKHKPKPPPPPPQSPPPPPQSPPPPPPWPAHPKFQYSEINCRAHFANLSSFGAVEGGETLNTDAFNRAIANLSGPAQNGGALLFVPAGKWLTGSFSLISHFTLFLHQDAVILGSQEESDYPLLEPLPSYGRGRDAKGKRFSSLIFGTNLTDVVVTGANGTIDGQGGIWWKKFKGGDLKNTRPYIIEIMHSTGVQISNLTLLNSPSWNVHPVYCTNVIIEQLTIFAPVTSPNTDGINPDSCKSTRIRNSKVTSGDDCIAIKSGWDQYGIQYAMPTQDVSINGFTCNSPDSAVIAIGSEMSGGVSNVRAEDIHAADTQSGIRIKTGVGRGGNVSQIYAQNMVFEGMKFVFWMTGDYGSHPDNKYNKTAFPVITDINYRNVKATGVYKYVGNLNGIEGDTFTGICISNVTAEMTQRKKSVYEEPEAKKEKKEKPSWVCSNVEGKTSRVIPKACDLLPETEEITDCHYPTDVLPIDKVVLKKCYG